MLIRFKSSQEKGNIYFAISFWISDGPSCRLGEKANFCQVSFPPRTFSFAALFRLVSFIGTKLNYP